MDQTGYDHQPAGFTRSTVVGLVGAICACISPFVPFISAPLVGSITLIVGGYAFVGWLVLILGVLSIGFSLFRYPKAMLTSGLIILAITLYIVISLLTDEERSALVSWNIGFATLFLSSVFLIFAYFIVKSDGVIYDSLTDRKSRVSLPRIEIQSGFGMGIILGLLGGVILGVLIESSTSSDNFVPDEALSATTETGQEIAPTSVVPTSAPEGSSKPVLELNVLRKEFIDRDFDDQIEFDLEFVNYLNKPIRGLQGTIHIDDILGDNIIKINFSYREPLNEYQKAEWTGSIDYNQFKDEHQRLVLLRPDQYRAYIEVNKIVNVDGEIEEY